MIIIGEARESIFLFQQLSITLQTEKRSPPSTILTYRRRCSHTLLSKIFRVCGFVLVDEK